MTMSSRGLIALGMSLALVGPIGVHPALSDSPEKEAVPEKAAPRPPQPPTATENPPAPHKPSPETKPSTSPAKTESSTEHKEAVPDKPAPHKPSPEAKPSTSPAKAESSTEHKEITPEKTTPRHQHPPAASDGQAVPHKPSADAKLPAQAPTAPTTKVEPPADKEKDANEPKEKEPVVKKPLGSLILSVKLALMGDSRLFRYEIEVEDDQQTVTLTGRVTNEEEKAAATEVAQAVLGVKTVLNKISLEKDLAKALLKKQDEILTTMIKERFAKSATLKAANFDVKTEEGIVQLNGSVRFQVLALEAAEAARQVPGVRAVNTEKVRLEGES